MKNFNTFLIITIAALFFLQCSSVNPLLVPGEELSSPAPEKFSVLFTTSKGEVKLDIQRKLSPLAVDRFYFLCKNGYYNENRFFRVVPNFVVQWGITGNPAINKIWENKGVKDEEVKASNVRGAISFARGGPDSRSNQMFINLRDNSRLDKTEFMGVKGFPVIGNVVSGMEAIDSIFAGYREKPNQDSIQQKGNYYLIKNFPKLDYIISTNIIE